MYFHLYYPHPSHYSVCHGVAYAFEPPAPNQQELSMIELI